MVSLNATGNFVLCSPQFRYVPRMNKKPAFRPVFYQFNYAFDFAAFAAIFFFAWLSFQTTKSELATKMEEYIPLAIPTINGRVKSFTDVILLRDANINRVMIHISTVTTVFIDLFSVCTTLLFTNSPIGTLRSRLLFSLIRS